MATFDSNLTLHSQKLETSGDLAYDSGDFQETLTTIANDAKIATKGSYIIIFKSQPNGSKSFSTSGPVRRHLAHKALRE